MQTVNRDGTLGKVEEFNEANMKKALTDPNVDHVDVFDGTVPNLKKRQKLVGKKYNPLNHKLYRGFKKARPDKKK